VKGGKMNSDIVYRFQTTLTDKNLYERMKALIAKGYSRVEIIRMGVEAIEKKEKK